MEGIDAGFRSTEAELIHACESYRALLDSVLPSTCPPSRLTTGEFIQYYKESVKLFSVPEAVRQARDAAQDTVVPPNYNDVPAILRAGSLRAYIQELHSKNDPDEFNAARSEWLLSQLDSDDITDRHRQNVATIASPGSTYCTPEDFVPSTAIPELRTKTNHLGKCQLKHAVKLRGKGKCLLLRMCDLPPGFLEENGFDTSCMAHWTPKAGADGVSLQADGRFLIDLNERDDGLNSDEAKALSAELYGPLSYPSIVDFIRDLHEFTTSNDIPLSEMRFFVEDNKGAFTSHKKDPSVCPLVCVRVAPGWLMVPIYGMFGHHAEPAVWEQPAAAVDALLRKKLVGIFRRYVDDRFHASPADRIALDHQLVHDINVAVYGANALDPEKSQPDGPTMTAIGWFLDAIKGTIRPSDKAIKKLVVAFFSVSISSSAIWSLKQCQMLASLAERYSLAMIGMRPFVQAFHGLAAHSADLPVHAKHHIKRTPTAAARFAVLMWRSAALALWADPDSLAVPMFSLLREIHAPIAYRPITDAAFRIGVRIFDSENRLLSWSSFPLPFISDRVRAAIASDYQNVKEFMGVLCTLLILRCRFQAPRGTAIAWTSDNMSAISWVLANKARSAYAQYAFAAYSWITVRAGYIVPEAIHTPGDSELMRPVDDLSRNVDLHLHDDSLRFDLEAVPAIVRLFQLISPLRLLESPASIARVHSQITSCLRTIFD